MSFFRPLAVMLLCAGAMFAQSNTGTQTSVGQPTDTNEPVFTGCLSGSHNNYFLVSDDGRQFRLHSDKDINEHVGHRVELRGTMKREGVDKPASAAAMPANQEIDVADVKSVGQSCWGMGASAGHSGHSGHMQSAPGAPMGSSTTASATQPCHPPAAAAAGAGMTTGSTTTGSTSATAPSAGTASGTMTAGTAGTSTTGSASATAPSAGTTTMAGNTGSQSSLPQSDRPQTDVGQATDNDEPLFTGCLTGSKKRFTLKADNGDQYRLHSDKDINEHNGNRVEIRGTLKPEGASKAKAGSQWKGELDVADIKSVGRGCAMGQNRQ